ncbi:phenylacetate--CoA ligase family protein [Capillimicrobium parvum]|uniref:Phenylacetate-coenzyme A ligase n=1 Tax=Capillimicrobium parvum TaxID=2884022 RepID=A0A9E6XX41_9ACTN|nr:AMP-binding protein [Capillimicrobium parvum]UGS36020.1 Phenylacetate-coenzyme A ligase [Capillimicrobium parvum]
MTAAYYSEHLETMSAGEVDDLQSRLLQRHLPALVARSPFYARKLAEAGCDARSIRRPRDLRNLPFTDKAELRESQLAAPPLGEYAGVPMRDVVRVHASSGTTGRPSYVGVTAADADAWADIAARVYWCEGMRPDDVVLHAFGLGFFVGGLPLAEAVQRIGATFIPLGTGATDRLLSSAADLGGTILSCTPSYARYLAEHMRDELGRDPRTLGVRRVLVGAEPGGAIPAVRDRIADDFGAEVRESVGNADVFPMYAATCDALDGNHLLAPERLIAEIVDPESGDVLEWEDGAEGELVATHLDRECVSLVRFRTRDRVVVRTTPCPCGRTAPRITCVGRTDDLLIVNGVNVWPSAISDVVSSVPRTTGAIEIVVPGPLPKVDPPVCVRVEHAAEPGDLETLCATLEGRIRDKLVVRAKVELLPPGTLPRSQAKTRLVRVLEPAEAGQ